MALAVAPPRLVAGSASGQFDPEWARVDMTSH
jgi:hypothetical protein